MNFELSKRVQKGIMLTSVISGFSVVALGFVLFYPNSYQAFLSIGLMIGFAGPALVFQINYRRKNLFDEYLPRLLQDIAESQETGMTLLQSLEESSRRKYGPLTAELKKLASKLSWGVAFEDAFQTFAKRLETEMAEKVVTLVLQANRLGGDLRKVFDSTASFAQKMIEIKKERSSQLRQYVFMIYTILIIFLVIIVVLYQSFFLPNFSGGNRFLVMPVSPETFKDVLTDLATIEAVVGGLIAGKLSEGSMFLGLKHSIALLVISLLVSTFYL